MYSRYGTCDCVGLLPTPSVNLPKARVPGTAWGESPRYFRWGESPRYFRCLQIPLIFPQRPSLCLSSCLRLSASASRPKCDVLICLLYSFRAGKAAQLVATGIEWHFGVKPVASYNIYFLMYDVTGSTQKSHSIPVANNSRKMNLVQRD